MRMMLLECQPVSDRSTSTPMTKSVPLPTRYQQTLLLPVGQGRRKGSSYLTPHHQTCQRRGSWWVVKSKVILCNWHLHFYSSWATLLIGTCTSVILCTTLRPLSPPQVVAPTPPCSPLPPHLPSPWSTYPYFDIVTILFSFSSLHSP